MKSSDNAPVDVSWIHRAETIEGKRVYIVEDHHRALLGWAMERRATATPMVLLSLDHHTDHRRAFGRDAGDDEEKRRTWIQALDFKSDESIRDALFHLHNDEHICAAIDSGVLSTAYSIVFSQAGDTPRSIEMEAHQAASAISFTRSGGVVLPPIHTGKRRNPPTRPFHDHPSSNGTYAIGSQCYVGCAKDSHSACARRLYDEALESPFLDRQIGVLKEMALATDLAAPLSDQGFILDIDLDYFHTQQSIAPVDATTFHQLIRSARAISIAEEPRFVENLALDASLRSDWLLEKMLNQISVAMK